MPEEISQQYARKYKGAIMRAAFRIARLLASSWRTDPEKLVTELTEILSHLERESGLFVDKTSRERVSSVDMPWG